MVFLAAENENRRLKDLPRADFALYMKIFLLSVRKNSITENYEPYCRCALRLFFADSETCFLKEDFSSQ